MSVKNIRHTVLVSLSQVVLAAVAALYGLLIPKRLGGQPVVCDAFFAAYAVYALFAVFSVSLRVSVVPSLASEEAGARDSNRKYGQTTFAVFALFACMAIAISLSSPWLGRLATSGLSAEGRRVASWLLLAFAPMILLQGMAFYYSGVLAAFGRLDSVSVVIMLSSIAGAIVFLLTPSLGLPSVLCGLFCFNVLWALALRRQLGRMGVAVQRHAFEGMSLRALGRQWSVLFAGSVPYVALSVAYMISQSLSTYCPQGVPTAFAYAYLLIATAVAVTGGAAGVALIKPYSDKASQDMNAFRGYLLFVLPACSLIASGVIGAAAVLSEPAGTILFSAFPASKDAAGHVIRIADAFARAVWHLSAGGWAMGILGTLIPAVLATRQTRGLLPLAGGLLLLHLLASRLGVRWMGLTGVGAGLSVTLMAFAACLLWRLQRVLGGRFLADAVRRCAGGAFSAAAAVPAAVWAWRSVELQYGWIVGAGAGLGVYAPTFLLFAFFIERETVRWLFNTVRQRLRPAAIG